jgi:hypothetical protein
VSEATIGALTEGLQSYEAGLDQLAQMRAQVRAGRSRVRAHTATH